MNINPFRDRYLILFADEWAKHVLLMDLYIRQYYVKQNARLGITDMQTFWFDGKQQNAHSLTHTDPQWGDTLCQTGCGSMLNVTTLLDSIYL